MMNCKDERISIGVTYLFDRSKLWNEVQGNLKKCIHNPYQDIGSKKIKKRWKIGPCAASLPWRSIAVILGILCLVILVIVVVLGTMGIWRSNSGSNQMKNKNFPSRNKENNSQPTRSPLEESVASPKPLTTTGVISNSCPANWISHKNSCYLFSTSLDSWNRSKRKCSQLGSYLLKIDSSNELEFIEKQVSSQPTNSFWIGLSRSQTEGPWLWEDGSMFSSNLFQIRSTVTQEDSSHNCAWIHMSIIFDQLCDVPSYSICEKKLSI